MRRSLLVLLTALAIPLILGAASPANVEPRKPGADTTPTITGLPSASSAASSEENATTVVTLPGAPDPQPAPPKVEVPLKTFVAPAPAAPAKPPAPRMALPEPQVPRTPESAVVARGTVQRSLPEGHPDRPLVQRDPALRLPTELEKDPAVYLQRQLGIWKLDDARKMIGAPVRDRSAFDQDKNADGRIYAFYDPTNRYRELELDFAKDTGALRAVYVYPWSMKWEDCRKLWGANVTAADASDGRKFFSYENRRLDVLVDRTGKVISLGLY